MYSNEQQNPMTVTDSMVNEKALTVAYVAMEKAEQQLRAPNPNIELIKACAAILEASANDWAEEDDNPAELPG